MPDIKRTKYSISAPLSYEEELDLIDKPDLIVHIVMLEKKLAECDARVADLEARLAKTGDTAELKLKITEQTQALQQRDSHIKKLEAELKTERDNVATLRGRVTTARAAAPEDLATINAFVKTLIDPGVTYYPKAVSRAFVEALRRVAAAMLIDLELPE